MSYIIVKVQKGMFASEKTVSFEAGGQAYSLIVDESDLSADSRLKVVVLDQSQDHLVIRLPRETFTSGRTLKVPRALVVEA